MQKIACGDLNLSMQERKMDASSYHAEVLARLQPFGEPGRVAWARNDKKSQLAFLAIKVPVLREALRVPFSFSHRPADEVLAIWSDIWFSSPYFEVMSAALMCYSRQGAKVKPETWPVLSTWSRRVENWAHADELAAIYYYLLAQRPGEVYPQLQTWNASDEQWLRRLSLVSLIHYSGKKAAFLPPERVLPLVAACVTDRRYYVQKAVGWVLREMAYAYPAEIRAFVEVHKGRMSGVSFMVATEHFRPEERQELLAWRKANREQTRAGRSLVRIARS
jgi:3-methyladenine DNA glycosylase AlkD